jgi:hypothetical protein
LLGYEMGDGCDVRIEAERYRQLARDFHLRARNLPAGEERAALLKMAEEYERLADQQERATDLRRGEHDGRRF